VTGQKRPKREEGTQHKMTWLPISKIVLPCVHINVHKSRKFAKFFVIANTLIVLAYFVSPYLVCFPTLVSLVWIVFTIQVTKYTVEIIEVIMPDSSDTAVIPTLQPPPSSHSSNSRHHDHCPLPLLPPALAYCHFPQPIPCTIILPCSLPFIPTHQDAKLLSEDSAATVIIICHLCLGFIKNSPSPD